MSARSSAKSKIFKLCQEGPSDASRLVCCCLPHHPVNCQVEEHRRHTTALSNTGLHAEAGLAASYPACEVVVETLDDKNNLLRYSICPENAP